MDLLTRDLQTSGMGLSCTSGTMAAIYYVNGASSAPDAMMILNGDPFAPAVDVDGDPVGSEFTCTLTGDVTVTGSGGSATFSYMGPGGTMLPLYQNFSAGGKYYVVYDATRARVIRPNGNGSSPSAGKMTLGYSTMTSPAGQFSTAMAGVTVLDEAAPDYPVARMAMLGTTVGYRVNTTTRELERTEDLTNWYSVARGVTDLQFRYRLLYKDGSGNPVNEIVDAPGNRGTVRAIEVRLSAETADLPSSAKAYRQVVQIFEVSPRNFNLLNNTNLSSDVD
jgi:hypothetical protein